MKNTAIGIFALLGLFACDKRQENDNSVMQPEKTEEISKINTDSLINEKDLTDDLSADTIDFDESILDFYLLENHIRECYPSKELDNLKLDTAMSKVYAQNALEVSEETFNQLSYRAKLVYCISTPELWYQNCSMYPSYNDSVVYPNLPAKEYYWSERQDSFFVQNRDQVIEDVVDCLIDSRSFDMNMAHVLRDLNAIEAIPALIDLYNKSEEKDLYILTWFVEILSKNEYQPYERWVNEEEIFALRSDGWGPSAKRTQKLEDKIKNLALGLYNS